MPKRYYNYSNQYDHCDQCECCECHDDHHSHESPNCPSCPPTPTPPPCIPTSYLTASSPSATVVPNDYLIFSTSLTSRGNNITHTGNTSEFTLRGGFTYNIQFSVNGYDTSPSQGTFFALVINQFITDTRISSQSLPGTLGYGSGTTYHFVEVPVGKIYTLKIINLGISTINYVQGNISIQQLP